MVAMIVGVLKRNVFNIVCVVVSVGSIVLGVMGMGAMSKVTDELNSVSTLHGKFSGAMRRPANNDIIEAEQKRVETIGRYYAAVMDRAKGLNRYEPMAPPAGETFFPEPSADGARSFPRIYADQFNPLLESLNAGVPPSVQDIDRIKDEMEEERRAAESFGEDEAGGSGQESSSKEKEPEHKSGLITEEAARNSPPARAAIRRARGIFCYANHDSFDKNRRALQVWPPPPPLHMWKAQLSLWVQQDVVASIARINRTAADAWRSENQRAWVGNLPVKDLVSIRVSDYLPASGGRQGGGVLGDAAAYPPGTGGAVFTQNSSTDDYEVVQFSLKLVIDVRDLPLIIDEICKDKFHTLLNISYAYDRDSLESLSMSGKIYGAEPTVKVVMDFETIFFGDTYRRMMPDTILSQIGKERPGDETEEN